MSTSPSLVLCERCGINPANLPEHDRLCDACREAKPVEPARCETCGGRCGQWDGTQCNTCRMDAYWARQEELHGHVQPREREVLPVPDEHHTCQALYGGRCRWVKATRTTLKCLRCGAIRMADNRYGYV